MEAIAVEFIDIGLPLGNPCIQTPLQILSDLVFDPDRAHEIMIAVLESFDVVGTADRCDGHAEVSEIIAAASFDQPVTDGSFYRQEATGYGRRCGTNG